MQRANPVDVRLRVRRFRFNGHPPLGVNATVYTSPRYAGCFYNARFNGHPPLGVNATNLAEKVAQCKEPAFQWAPTLGGECYLRCVCPPATPQSMFQWAPTLGGECYLGLIYGSALPF